MSIDTEFQSYQIEETYNIDTRLKGFWFETIIDTIPPTGTVSVAPFVRSLNIKLNLTATDMWTGVKCVEISNDGIEWTRFDWIGNGEYDWTITPGYGVKTIYVRYRDKEITPKIPDGNVSEIYQANTVFKKGGRSWVYM